MKIPIHHFVAVKPIRASAVATVHFKIDPDEFERLLSFGAVYLNKKRIDRDVDLGPKDYLRLHPKPKRFQVPIDLRSRVLFQNEKFIVINKPAGLPVHASLDNRIENIAHQMRAQLGISILVTHRIDIPVEGCLLLAKSKDAQREANNAFLHDTVEKRYRCLTGHPLEVGTYVDYMDKTPNAPKRLWPEPIPNVPEGSEGSRLRCELEVVRTEPGNLPNSSLSEIRLVTGRTHQIRAQLASRKNPILGDTLYGGERRPEFQSERIALQSYFLSFPGIPAIELPSPW